MNGDVAELRADLDDRLQQLKMDKQHEHDVARGKRQRGKRQRRSSKHQAAQEEEEEKEKKEGRGAESEERGSEGEMEGEEEVGEEDNGADEWRGVKKGGREGGEMRRGEMEMVRGRESERVTSQTRGHRERTRKCSTMYDTTCTRTHKHTNTQQHNNTTTQQHNNTTTHNNTLTCHGGSRCKTLKMNTSFVITISTVNMPVCVVFVENRRPCNSKHCLKR